MPDDAPPSSRLDLNEEILLVEAQLSRAQLRGDVAMLDRLLDERLLFVGPNGVVATKHDDLANHRSGAQRMTRVEPETPQIVRHGPVAVVAVRVRLAGVFHGEAFEGVYAYTRTWLRQDAGWRVVAGQVTAVADA